MSYSSSSAITSSTMSSESAPRSSMKEACGVTSSSLTPSCSQMISFTFCSTLDPITPPWLSRLPRVAHLRHHRGEIHDPPVPGADHGTDRGLGTVEDAGQVGAQDPLPVLLLEPQEERVHGHARIVDEEVEPPVLVNDVLHPDTHRLGVADVEAGRGGAAAGGGDQAHRLFGCGRVLAEVDHR